MDLARAGTLEASTRFTKKWKLSYVESEHQLGVEPRPEYFSTRGCPPMDLAQVGTLEASTRFKKKARGFPLEGLTTVPWNTNLSNEAESQRIDTRGVSTVYNTPYHLSRLQRILWAELTI